MKIADKKKKSANNKSSKKNNSNAKDYSNHESSDDDGGDLSEEEEDFDLNSYRKLLSDMFPSKYMKEKVRNEVLDNGEENDDENEKDDDVNDKKVNKKKKQQKKKKKRPSCKKKNKAPSASTDADADDDQDDQDDAHAEADEKLLKYFRKMKDEFAGETADDDDDVEDESASENENEDDEELDEEAELAEMLNNPRNSKFNIIFTLSGQDFDSEEEYDSEEDEDYILSEDEDDEEDEGEYEHEEDEEDRTRPYTRSMAKKKSSKTNNKNKNDKDHNDDKNDKKKSETSKAVRNNEALEEIEAIIKNLPENLKNNKIVQEMLEVYEKKKDEHNKAIVKKEKKIKNKNVVAFKKQLREKNVMNDAKFFKEKLTIEEQNIVLRQIEELKSYCDVEKPYRLSLLNADIPVEFKAAAYKKLSTLRYMEPGGGEYYKIKTWVDTFMRLPFGMYKNLPLQIGDGIERCHEFMDEAMQTLDKAVFGLNDAKLQIMQMVGQWITNPSAVGSAIAIKGPMGTGKTTLVREGISKILGRDFAFIALGGATDSSFLEGHSYTYEGSTWGKIVDILLQCKCMNPVIYFDELDKVSDTPKGEEIIGILTHLTDTSQNSKFHDKYYSELDFDLSRCLFIFSYNDESKVNPILKDRMYRIQTRGYKDAEKITIAADYLLPKIREQIKFKKEDVTIPEDTLKYIITEYTDKEDGVRNLKRCLEIIHSKLNLYRLMKPDTNLFGDDLKLKVTFPVTVTNEMVQILINKNKKVGNWQHMYM